MTYVDAIYDSRKNVVKVVERIGDKRVVKDYPCEWTFYYSDPDGDYQTIFRTPVRKFSTRNHREYLAELEIRRNRTIWESDINIVNKTLEKYYSGALAPKLNVCFFDIEVDFSALLGFAPVEDPFNKITAISLYCTWVNDIITLAIPPNTLSMEEAEKLIDFPNTFLFDNEADMLEAFLDLIEEADVLSGWNSEGYDIPYTVRRIERVLSKNDTRRLCLFSRLPKERKYEKFGKKQLTYDLFGRIHLDSLNLYVQYTYHEMHSYSLDTIAEYELGERKIQYIGTLDQLYNEDFYKFIDYNRQDTMILKKLDDKLQFISLANEISHDNTVLIPSALGAVGVTDQAIINYAHSLGYVVQNRTQHDDAEDHRAAGAYVATPKKGLHKWIGAIDINSLYPSAIRALNMSPETIVGQLTPTYTDKYINEKIDSGKSFAGAWEGMFGSLEYSYVMDKDETKNISIDWEESSRTSHSASEIYDIIFHSNNKWMLSANGTIFRYDIRGIIPGILEKWYSERKELQAKKAAWIELSSGISEDHGLFDTIKSMVQDDDIYKKDDKWFHNDPSIVKEQIAFWDKRQLVKKINLNSLYGAVLNQYCRFYVFDIGQSTTLTGRCITRHMSAYVNECLAGEYDHLGKSILYGDTDSVANDTIIETTEGNFTIEHLFHKCSIKWANNDKEFAVDDINVATYDPNTQEKILAPINYIYRHKVSKPKWKITDEHNNVIEITNDHSIMVERDGKLIEVKPENILDTDLLIVKD